MILLLGAWIGSCNRSSKKPEKTSGHGLPPAKTGSKPESTNRAEKMAQLDACVKAFSGALEEYETEMADSLEQVSESPGIDQYNLPINTWAKLVDEGISKGQNWHFCGNFSPMRRETVLTWWLKKRFEEGVTPDSLAHVWLPQVKDLEPSDPEDKAYGDAVMERYDRQLKDILGSGKLAKLRSHAKEALAAADHKNAKTKAVAVIVIALVLVFLAGVILADFGKTGGTITLAILIGGAIGIAIAQLGIIPLINNGVLESSSKALVTVGSFLFFGFFTPLFLKPRK
ncbi:MAG: hypothetical protein V1846_03115 [Candidatus Komeilibacteria bacterium]